MNSNADTHPPILVIGIGNEDRGDDAAGLIAVRHLEAQTLPGVVTVEARGDAVDLMERWADPGIQTVYLIDAMRSDTTPGTIQRFDAGKAPLPALHIEGLTHSFGPVEAVELARALGMLPPRLILYAIEGARYDNNVPPSPAVRRAAQQVAECIRGECLALQPEALASTTRR
ncbi:MAG: hydrogenase maturation protease [Chloroflexi bacterium]|nr:hydrogenase maturation protease [Chloroflexota bacterium]